MNSPDNDDQWSTEQVQAELEAVLADIRTLDAQLVEPLGLTDSIRELETTIAAYDRVEPEDIQVMANPKMERGEEE